MKIYARPNDPKVIITTDDRVVLTTMIPHGSTSFAAMAILESIKAGIRLKDTYPLLYDSNNPEPWKTPQEAMERLNAVTIELQKKGKTPL